MFRIPRDVVLQILPGAVVMLLITVPEILGGWIQSLQLNQDQEYLAFHRAGIAVMSVWLWLQWPRRRSAYIIYLIAIGLIVLPRFAFGLYLSWKYGNVYSPRAIQHAQSCGGIIAVSTTLAILLRVAARWRLIDHLSANVNTDRTARSGISDLLIASIGAAITFAIARHSLSDTGLWISFRPHQDVLFAFAVVIAAIGSLRLLSNLHWFPASIAAILLSVLVGVGLSFSAGVATHWTGEGRWGFSHFQSNWLQAGIREAYVGSRSTLVVIGLVLLLRANQIRLTSYRSTAVSGLSKVSLAIGLASITATVMLLQCVNLYQPWGVLDRGTQSGMRFAQRGWPLTYQEFETASFASGTMKTIMWNSTSLAIDLVIAVVVSVFLGIVGPIAVKRSFGRRTAKNVGSSRTESIRAVSRFASAGCVFRWTLAVAFLSSPFTLVGLAIARYWETDACLVSQKSLRQRLSRSGDYSIQWSPVARGFFDDAILYVADEIFHRDSRGNQRVLTSVRVQSPSESLLDEICQSRWVRFLSIRNSNMTDSQIESLLVAGQLSTLRVQDATLPANAAQRIASLRSLTELSLVEIPNPIAAPHFYRGGVQRLHLPTHDNIPADAFPDSVESLTLELSGDAKTLELANLPKLQTLQLTTAAEFDSLRIKGCQSLQTIELNVHSRVFRFAIDGATSLYDVAINDSRETEQESTKVDLDWQDVGTEVRLTMSHCRPSHVALSQPPPLINLEYDRYNPKPDPPILVTPDPWLSVFPPGSLGSVHVHHANIDTDTIAIFRQHSRLSEVIALVSKVDSTALDEFASDQNVRLFLPGWKPNDKQFASLLSRCPSLAALSCNGSRLTQIDLSQSKPLGRLELSHAESIQKFVIGESRPSSIRIWPEPGWVFLRHDQPCLQLYGPAFTGPIVRKLLRGDPELVSLRDVGLKKAEWKGMDFGGCSSLTLVAPEFDSETLGSLRFGARPESNSIRELRLSVNDGLDIATLQSVFNRFRFGTIFQLNHPDHHLVDGLIATPNCYIVAMPYSRDVCLRGQTIDTEIANLLSRSDSIATLDLRWCTISRDAIRAFRSNRKHMRVYLDHATFDLPTLIMQSKLIPLTTFHFRQGNEAQTLRGGTIR